MTLALALAVWVGASQAKIFVLPDEVTNLSNLGQGFVKGLESIRFFSTASVLIVWLHNLRSMALASLLGIFSFGVLGVLVLMLPITLIGYFTASVASAGASPLTFLTALVLPHGILELPAMILAGAAIMGIGATLAAPAQGKTIGEALLVSIARWAKVMVGLVLPLALGAAALEVFVTPRIAIMLLGG
jgi:uncharacterized membrane protein SpoIIM required for sporulation